MYKALAGIVASGERQIERVRISSILPRTTVFHETVLSFDGRPKGTADAITRRLAVRTAWFEGALQATAGCDLIFLDPDNGLEIASVRRHQDSGVKYVFLDEARSFIERGQSLVIYDQLCRTGRADEQIEARMQEPETLSGRRALALRYRRGTSRAYLTVPASAHTAALTQRTEQMMLGRWSEHFDFHRLAP